MVTFKYGRMWCWWPIFHIGDQKFLLVPNSVTILTTHLISNILHQHRCHRFKNMTYIQNLSREVTSFIGSSVTQQIKLYKLENVLFVMWHGAFFAKWPTVHFSTNQIKRITGSQIRRVSSSLDNSHRGSKDSNKSWSRVNKGSLWPASKVLKTQNFNPMFLWNLVTFDLFHVDEKMWSLMWSVDFKNSFK